MFKGNADNVMADADRIAGRLRHTSATLTGLMKEYHCGWPVIMKAVLSQMSKSQWKRIRKRKLSQGGVEYQFKKGHTTWNKGRKGIHLSPATEFKKGHLPIQHRHVGSICIVTRKRKGNVTRYRKIKVSGIMQGEHKWVLYSKYIYEQKHGPVPKGCFVVHVDGDALNDDDDNLRVVDRKGHLALQMQRDPKMVIKCRRNAARATRKRHKANRRRKAKLPKKQKENSERIRRFAEHFRRAERKEAQHKAQFESGIIKLEGDYTTWWECTGCGFEYVLNDPPLPCPKCGGLNYERIIQKRVINE